MSGTDVDLAVVGAGPAGAAAAVTAARGGQRVMLIDRARFPRDKCCGDGLTAAALRLLEEMGLAPGAVASWQAVGRARLRSPSGRVTTLALPPREEGLFAAVARRTDLDAALVTLAREAGATVVEGHGVTGAAVRRESDAPSRSAARGRGSGPGPWGPVTIEVEGLGTISARYAVGADGMWSPLRKALGCSETGYLGEWHAFRQYFTGVAPAGADLWVWFEPDLLPGYAWSFPLPGGRANLGFGLRRRPGQQGRQLRASWEALLERPHVRDLLGDATAEAPHRAWPIPARIAGGDLTAAGGRVLFAGDAARACDPMTGEGIGQALETGSLAARAILSAGGQAPERVAAQYRRAVAAGLSVDNRVAGMLSRLLLWPAGVRGAVRAAGSTAWFSEQFARWMFEDIPRAAAVTPWRWHRGAMGAPGPYR